MLKPGVDIQGLQPQMVLAFAIIQPIYHRMGYECVITAACDGKHLTNSLHYKGLALDFRIKHVISIDKPRLIKDIKDALGQDFDVLLEDAGTPNEHAHVEHDPKPRTINPEER